MDREEAIKMLKRELEPVDPIFPEVQQALDMAIDALEKSHCEECLFFGMFHRCKECDRVNVIYDDKFETGE